MGDLTVSDVFAAASQQDWLAQLIVLAQQLGLPATSFRPGDIARTILAIMSFADNKTDATVALISQGGFLDFAATGTVTYDNPDGSTTTVFVSPDPSNPEQNPTGALTWLDVLTDQNYDVQRILATSAGGSLALVNTSVSTYGAFDAGAYHVSDPFNKATYSNVSSLTVPPSSIAGTAITNAVTDAGLIKITTSANHGLTTGDAVFIRDVTGTTEANGAWYVTVLTATTFDLIGSTFVNAFVSGGKVYLPTVASFAADVAGSAYTSLDAAGVANIHTVTTAVTALVGVSVDNLAAFEGSDIESNPQLRDRTKLKLKSLSPNGPSGAYEFFALSAITYAPKLSPAQKLSVTITRALVAADKLTGHVNVFIANATGAPSTADKNVTDAVIQAYATPNGVTATTLKATNVSVAAVFQVYLKAVYATTANNTLFVTALQNYFKALPIGGLTDPGGDYTNVVPFEDVRGVIYETADANKIPLDNVTGTLNSGTSNIALLVNSTEADVAVLSPAAPTVTFHPT